MLRINGFFIVGILFCLIAANPSLSRADSSVNNPRNAIVQKQLDCVSRSYKNTGIDWQDVCEIPDNSLQNQDDKTQEVNRELDEVSQQFPPMQQDAQKIFSNADHPERPSAPSMLKDILNPDLWPSAKPKTPSNLTTRVHTFDTGGEIFYFRYQEPTYVDNYGNTNEDTKYRGPMYGYYANYAYRPADPNFFNNFLTNVYFLQARFAAGGVEYRGYGVNNNEHSDQAEFRGLIGKDYYVGSDTIVTPYFGFGYRYVYENGNGKMTDQVLLENEKSHYYYLPLGWDTRINILKGWEIDPNFEYDIFLQGFQKSYSSDWNQFTGGNFPDVRFHQDHGFGLRGSLKFLKKGPKVDFYVEPYIRFWNIEESKPVFIPAAQTSELFVEPKNTTTEIGSKFGIQF